MDLIERRQQFELAIRSHTIVKGNARIALNFGFSNSARVIEGGLFAGTNNLESYSRALASGTAVPLEQLILLCVLTFPPHDEVYFAIVVESEVTRLNDGLLKLFRDGESQNLAAAAAGTREGKVNNNVKFYITGSGELYFHNKDFRESLVPNAPGGALDPDCTVRIDSVLFSIWPPATSARRSLLARDFVGYLGNLVDRQRVHELRAWDHSEIVSPLMRRMPAAIDIEEIESRVHALGGHYPHGEVRRLHAALNFLTQKHFVILAGLSGTGKTQLALKYAQAVHGMDDGERNALVFVCPVRPEWTDPSGLTGYYDVLSNRYVVPPFLEAILEATSKRDSPVFVILDEMNLARVEYYLSDVLSAMETGVPLQLHSNSVPLEGTNGIGVRAELALPQNLFIVGTINIDETTNPVSDKVLDRASVIDMTQIDVPGFLVSLEARDSSLKAARAACESTLTDVHGMMQLHGFGFGYRVVEEFVRYHAFDAAKLGTPPSDVTDQLLVQKVLVKLRGGERQRGLLSALAKRFEDLPRTQAFVSKLLSELDDFGTFQAMR